MKRKLLMVILICLMNLFLLLRNNYAIAESCDDIYIVNPGNNEGGTFYLSLESDPITNTFPRAGYIQAMTLIKVVTENGFLKELSLSEEKRGTRYPYVKFVGSDGSFGYIKRTSITPLMSLLKYKNQSIDCTSPYKLVTPISPVEEVILFNKPEDRKVTPRQISKFSRSSLDVVFTDESFDYWDNEDHSAQIPFYIVRFSQKQKDGTFRESDALVEAVGEDKIYRLFPINPRRYERVRVFTEEEWSSKLRRFVSRFLSDYSYQELARALGKSCDVECTVRVTIKVGAAMPFKFIQIGGEIAGTADLKFPRGYRYSLDCYTGFISRTESEVLKTVHCERNSTTDWYTDHMMVNNIGEERVAFEIFQHQLEKRLSAFFEKPDTTGIAGIKREAMVTLKKFEKNGDKDYFTAFSELDKYLGETFFNRIDLTAVEKLQFKNLIMRLIVDCRK